jgi:hypothetical protein
MEAEIFKQFVAYKYKSTLDPGNVRKEEKRKGEKDPL